MDWPRSRRQSRVPRRATAPSFLGIKVRRLPCPCCANDGEARSSGAPCARTRGVWPRTHGWRPLHADPLCDAPAALCRSGSFFSSRVQGQAKARPAASCRCGACRVSTPPRARRARAAKILLGIGRAARRHARAHSTTQLNARCACVNAARVNRRPSQPARPRRTVHARGLSAP
ncbi:hypothetical protein BC834DRAFT_892958, partial [Gloeopeniophorella convolvens]